MEENRRKRLARRHLETLRGNDADLRAMKRALANAPLGPKAVLALTAAIIAVEGEPGLRARPHSCS